MNIEKNRQKWLKALRSGKYVQCYSYWRLCDSYCPLGVLIEITRPWYMPRYIAFGTKRFKKGVGKSLAGINGNDVIRWNDVDRLSFSQIADKLEKIFTTEPK